MFGRLGGLVCVASATLTGVSAATQNSKKDTEHQETQCTMEKHKKQDAQETQNDGKKRMNYLNWDEYFMTIALVSAQRSKDPHKQVGACIVNQDKRIVGVGYNGFPDGISDDDEKYTWDKKGKHKFVCHAECNAILNKMSMDLKGCTIYTSLYPCDNCAKIIIQSGIKTVIYAERKDVNADNFKASPILFSGAGVKEIKFADLDWQPKARTAHVGVDLQILKANLCMTARK